MCFWTSQVEDEPTRAGGSLVLVALVFLVIVVIVVVLVILIIVPIVIVLVVVLFFFLLLLVFLIGLGPALRLLYPLEVHLMPGLEVDLLDLTVEILDLDQLRILIHCEDTE